MESTLPNINQSANAKLIETNDDAPESQNQLNANAFSDSSSIINAAVSTRLVPDAVVSVSSSSSSSSRPVRGEVVLKRHIYSKTKGDNNEKRNNLQKEEMKKQPLEGVSLQQPKQSTIELSFSSGSVEKQVKPNQHPSPEMTIKHIIHFRGRKINMPLKKMTISSPNTDETEDLVISKPSNVDVVPTDRHNIMEVSRAVPSRASFESLRQMEAAATLTTFASSSGMRRRDLVIRQLSSRKGGVTTSRSCSPGMSRSIITENPVAITMPQQRSRSQSKSNINGIINLPSTQGNRILSKIAKREEIGSATIKPTGFTNNNTNDAKQQTSGQALRAETIRLTPKITGSLTSHNGLALTTNEAKQQPNITDSPPVDSGLAANTNEAKQQRSRQGLRTEAIRLTPNITDSLPVESGLTADNNDAKQQTSRQRLRTERIRLSPNITDSLPVDSGLAADSNEVKQQRSRQGLRTERIRLSPNITDSLPVDSGLGANTNEAKQQRSRQRLRTERIRLSPSITLSSPVDSGHAAATNDAKQQTSCQGPRAETIRSSSNIIYLSPLEPGLIADTNDAKQQTSQQNFRAETIRLSPNINDSLPIDQYHNLPNADPPRINQAISTSSSTQPHLVVASDKKSAADHKNESIRRFRPYHRSILSHTRSLDAEVASTNVKTFLGNDHPREDLPKATSQFQPNRVDTTILIGQRVRARSLIRTIPSTKPSSAASMGKIPNEPKLRDEEKVEFSKNSDEISSSISDMDSSTTSTKGSLVFTDITTKESKLKNNDKVVLSKNSFSGLKSIHSQSIISNSVDVSDSSTALTNASFDSTGISPKESTLQGRKKGKFPPDSTDQKNKCEISNSDSVNASTNNKKGTDITVAVIQLKEHKENPLGTTKSSSVTPPLPQVDRVDSPSDIRSTTSSDSMTGDEKIPLSGGQDEASGLLRKSLSDPSLTVTEKKMTEPSSQGLFFDRFSVKMKRVKSVPVQSVNKFDTISFSNMEALSDQTGNDHSTKAKNDIHSGYSDSCIQSSQSVQLSQKASMKNSTGVDIGKTPLLVFSGAHHNGGVQSLVTTCGAVLSGTLSDTGTELNSITTKSSLDQSSFEYRAPHQDILSSLGYWTPGSPPPPPPPEPPISKKKKKKNTPKQLAVSTHRSPAPHQMTYVGSQEAICSHKTQFFKEDGVPGPEVDNVKYPQIIEQRQPLHDAHEFGVDPGSESAGITRNYLTSREISPDLPAIVEHDAKNAVRVASALSAAVLETEKQEISKVVYVGSFHDAVTIGSDSLKSRDTDMKSERDAPASSEVEPQLFDADFLSDGSYVTISSKQRDDIKDMQKAFPGKRAVYPSDDHPSPFETAVACAPQILSKVLSFIGDPAAVCRVKIVSKACFEYVEDNEHRLMKDAVRLGGIAMNVRPSFWLWVTLQKSSHLSIGASGPSRSQGIGSVQDLQSLEYAGRAGKWHHVIERDVARSFGNLPPHKSGARLRTDSIVRALVSWGKNRTMKRGLRGYGPPPSIGNKFDEDDASLAPTDTVNDWGAVTPAISFTSHDSSGEPRTHRSKQRDRAGQHSSTKRSCLGELALSGSALADEVKISLQDKLGFILHALASAHSEIGYCQGMDYVVAHLLRILQDTVRWKAETGRLPSVILSTPKTVYRQDMSHQERLKMDQEINGSLVVEEACFRVMDSFLSVYNLRHFYWPELRCLKTCCLVFEKLIKVKLPVLADHFEHHELSVGLFALGWFQTLFLYLPSMPAATVCHVWDIWLVERSFKIFFRVGAAILFLSQPILLNHELEGMMSYLNTFPDATLLSPDILIACALQIKVTNRLLMELESEVSAAAASGSA